MFIAFIFFPEMFFIPKHIAYNHHHYSFIRTTVAQTVAHVAEVRITSHTVCTQKGGRLRK